MWWACQSPEGQQILGHCSVVALTQYLGLAWHFGQDGLSRQQLLLGSRGRNKDSGTQEAHKSQQATLTSAQHDPLLQTAPWEQIETTQGVVETTLQKGLESKERQQPPFRWKQGGVEPWLNVLPQNPPGGQSRGSGQALT